ncbi:MAG: hypothetical protein LWY06_15480 [Firmicutes bacterium]|nr:hypothetical protein [Bacillota bacterium]
MSEELKTVNTPLDLKLSSNGKFAALKISCKPAEGNEHGLILVFNMDTGQKVFEHKEASITHLEWHPVYNRLLFIGVLSGLNSVDINDDGHKEVSEGIVKHSTLFLEYFHFSPKGRSAAYLLRNIEIVPESAMLEEKNIKNIIHDEEKAQVLFYEKADNSSSIEGLGRAWCWYDDDRLLYVNQGEIFIRDVVWNTKKKLASHDEFILDFTPWKKKTLIVSIDYANLLTSAGHFRVLEMDQESGDIKPIKIEGDFVPEIIPLGDNLIFNRRDGHSHIIVQYDPETAEEIQLTDPEKISRFPRVFRSKVFYLSESEGRTELHSVDVASKADKTLFCLSDFFEQV